MVNRNGSNGPQPCHNGGSLFLRRATLREKHGPFAPIDKALGKLSIGQLGESTQRLDDALFTRQQSREKEAYCIAL